MSGELDFAIMHTPGDIRTQPQFHFDIMRRDPFVIALAPDHPLIRQAERKDGYPYPVLDVRLLKNESFLMLHKSQRIRQITDEVLGRAGIQRPKISLTLRNFETAQLLAAQGMGVTFVPLEYSRITSEEYLPALLSIDNAYQAHWDMCITSLKRGFLSKADQLFIRIAKEELCCK